MVCRLASPCGRGLMIALLLPAASSELQRVAFAVFHLISAARRLFRAQHVRRSRRRELSQVPSVSGERGKTAKRKCAP